jgi:hypothetical protein
VFAGTAGVPPPGWVPAKAAPSCPAAAGSTTASSQPTHADLVAPPARSPPPVTSYDYASDPDYDERRRKMEADTRTLGSKTQPTAKKNPPPTLSSASSQTERSKGPPAGVIARRAADAKATGAVKAADAKATGAVKAETPTTLPDGSHGTGLFTTRWKLKLKPKMHTTQPVGGVVPVQPKLYGVAVPVQPKPVVVAVPVQPPPAGPPPTRLLIKREPGPAAAAPPVSASSQPGASSASSQSDLAAPIQHPPHAEELLARVEAVRKDVSDLMASTVAASSAAASSSAGAVADSNSQVL